MLNGVFSFYNENFTDMMSQTLDADMIRQLRVYMNEGREDFYELQKERLKAEAGNLGINNYRNLYILDMNGDYLAGTNDELGQSLAKTPNMLAAMNKKTGDKQSFGAEYMDYALYISSSVTETETECIIYIKDTLKEMRSFSEKILGIIIQILLIGLAVAVLLSFFLAKAITSPIQNITKNALKLADGNFDEKISASSKDEIGDLTTTFGDMSGKLKYMLDQSYELEKSRKEFIANVSHELKTPLTSIIGAADMIYESRITEENKIKFLNMILSEGERMQRIVEDLLVISSIDNKKVMWRFGFVKPEGMAKNIYEAMRVEAEKNNQVLTLAVDRDISDLYADKGRMEQVIMNVVSNAIKYTPHGGKIELALKNCRIKSNGSDLAGIKFIVKDNGVGIPKEDLPNIFDRFYRVDKSRSAEAGGTGLGLSIAKEIVQAHKGEIMVDNVVGGGTGTIVTIILPQNFDSAEE